MVREEFFPVGGFNSPPSTEISGSPTTTVISTGNPLPAPIALAAGDTSPSGSIEQLERYEECGCPSLSHSDRGDPGSATS